MDLVTDNGPHIVYWSERTCAWVQGHWLATGEYYELYDRERRRFIDGFTKSCVFPTRVEAEAVAARDPQWKTMPLQRAEELFLREGDRRP